MSEEAFEALIEAAKEGSEQAWTALLEPVAPRLIGYLRLRGSKDPEAAAGDVFADVARNIDAFEGAADGFDSWVFVIAHRRLIDEYRRSSARPEEVLTDRAIEPSAAASAEEEAMRIDSIDVVAGMLDDLTGPQRDVIILRVVAGLSIEETAEVLNRPGTAVKALQRRGLAALRRKIEQQGVSR